MYRQTFYVGEAIARAYEEGEDRATLERLVEQGEGQIVERTFETHKELVAFREGIEVTIGWFEVAYGEFEEIL